MDEGGDFMELLELQGNLEMVTKSELLDLVRKYGRHISDRQLTSFMSEGLIPKSARIGSRGGAYPRIVVDLVLFITRFRRRGLSVTAIKELLPTWRYLRRALREHEISLAEFEYIARQTITLQEAWFAVPSLLMDALPCPNCGAGQLDEVRFRLKDGSVQPVDGDDAVSVGFVMAQLDDESGTAKAHYRVRLAIPRPDEGYNTSSVILGVTNGIPLHQPGCAPEDVSAPASDSRVGVEEGD
jgi:DNA-binding transcriptional MerR regulator